MYVVLDNIFTTVLPNTGLAHAGDMPIIVYVYAGEIGFGNWTEKTCSTVLLEASWPLLVHYCLLSSNAPMRVVRTFPSLVSLLIAETALLNLSRSARFLRWSVAFDSERSRRCQLLYLFAHLTFLHQCLSHRQRPFIFGQVSCTIWASASSRSEIRLSHIQ